MKRNLSRNGIGRLAASFLFSTCFAFASFAQKTVGPVPPLPDQTDLAKKAEAARRFIGVRYALSPLYGAMWQSFAEGCPVAMVAKRLAGDGDMVKVGRADTRGPSQRIRLTLHNRSNSKKVLRARAAVRGTDGKPRVSTLAGSTGLSGEVTRTISLDFTDHGESWAATDLLLRGLTSVSQLSLLALTYEDGTTWQRGGGSSCTVEPDPLLLIGQ